MTTSDNSSKCGSSGDYLTKQVLLNGQFVTLYSINGHTWLSSPEDIPALMDRLESERMSLFNGEKAPQAAESKGKEAEGGADKSTTAPTTKYRMKGPKPRPILEQDGKIFKGPSVEPVSASSTVMKFSSDLPESEVPRKSKTGGKTLSKAKVKKLLSEVADIPKKAKKKVSKGKQHAATKKSDGAKKKEKSATKGVSKSQVKKKVGNSRSSTKATSKATASKSKKPIEKKKSTSKKVAEKKAVKNQSKSTKASPAKKSKGSSSSPVRTSKKSISQKSSKSTKTTARKVASKKGLAR